jgi:hypothetical protein
MSSSTLSQHPAVMGESCSLINFYLLCDNLMTICFGFCVEIQKVDLSGSQIQQAEKDREAESDSDDDDDLSSDSDDSDSFVHIPMPKCYQYNLVQGKIPDHSYKHEISLIFAESSDIYKCFESIFVCTLLLP